MLPFSEDNQTSYILRSLYGFYSSFEHYSNCQSGDKKPVVFKYVQEFSMTTGLLSADLLARLDFFRTKASASARINQQSFYTYCPRFKVHELQWSYGKFYFTKNLVLFAMCMYYCCSQKSIALLAVSWKDS